MPYDIVIGDRVLAGVLGKDNKIEYDKKELTEKITEMVAGQAGSKSFFTTAKIVYRYNRTRKSDSDTIYNLWKENPVMQNRIIQLNSLVFGRGLKYIYDEKTKAVVDRFWRINRLKIKLNAINTDAQLYGEVFIGLFPQKSGDVLLQIYESNQVDIDFDPANVYNVNKYIVTYRDEEKNSDEQYDMMPIEKYLNGIEFTTGVVSGIVSKVRKMLGLNGAAKVEGKGVMVHVKFNNATSEVYGTSDFKQVSTILPEYMDFMNDRLTIHQLYGSPAYDIEIDTDEPNDIVKRIEELDGFQIGSNPVHNSKEKWSPLEFKNGGLVPDGDEKMMRGLLCAGMQFPEYLLFNQADVTVDNTFALQKIAENRQDTFSEALTDIHKFVVAIAGGDPSTVDEGQIIFPEICTMPEKAKAEAYVLKVGANICSRRTAATSLGYNWDIEEQQIQNEHATMGDLMSDNSDVAGAVGGRFTSRINNQDPNADHGGDDKRARANAENITTQVMGNHKTNN
jgi:hypothetical protein